MTPSSTVKKQEILPKDLVNASKVPRRSSKPIINWFQRKLGSHVKHKRFTGTLQQVAIHTESERGKPVAVVRQSNRIASSPLPASSSRRGSVKQGGKLDQSRRKATSLDNDNDDEFRNDDDLSFSSYARDSTQSPPFEADEDASVRPLPPSSPPSPSPSTSSYLSNPNTFRSIAASTKPTTVLSIDLAPNGVAHIAQVPGTPLSTVARFQPHIRSPSTSTNPGILGSGASVSFSAFPTSGPSSRPASLLQPLNLAPSSSGQRNGGHGHDPILTVQAPLHTTHHPRNNPRPSSPPLDNASVLTLASSAFAFAGSRIVMPGWGSTPSALGPSDSLSHFGGGAYADAESTSQFVLGDDDRLEERDANASVRALRPRSSRRGSWGSETSDWSARLQAGTTSSPIRERSSLWTNAEGQFSTENDVMDQQSDERNAAVDSADGVSESDYHLTFGDGGTREEDESVRLSDIAETPDAPTQALPKVISDHDTHSTDTVAQVDDNEKNGITS